MPDARLNQEFIFMIPISIFEYDDEKCIHPVTRKEAKHAVWDMEPDKAPRPDVFPVRFLSLLENYQKRSIHNG